MMRLALVATFLLAGGCLQAPAPASDDEWYLGGSFTAEFTDDDIAAVCAAVREHAPDCAIMESFPPQFGFRFPSRAACDDARARILIIPHTNVRDCNAPPSPTSEPDRPVSTTRPSPVSSTPSGAVEAEFSLETVNVQWADGGSRDEVHAMEWEVARAWQQGGLVTIETTTQGIEGGDFRFTVWYQPRAERIGLYYHEPDAATVGTFDFRYTESVFWTGEPIGVVTSADRASWVRIERVDADNGLLRGAFHLDFVGECQEGEFGCVQGGSAEHHRILDGSFGP